MAVKNGIALLAASALGAAAAFADAVKASVEYPEFYNGDTTKGIEFVQAIKVLAPRYCSNVKGNVTVVFEAKGMARAASSCSRRTRFPTGRRRSVSRRWTGAATRTTASSSSTTWAA